LTKLGVEYLVIAPTLVAVKAGDRVKTDRRDAERLAKSFRAGDLTPVWVPDAAHEALRDLVRAREAAKKDQLRARHRLGKFLLRQGRRPAERMTRGRNGIWIGAQRPKAFFPNFALVRVAYGPLYYEEFPFSFRVWNTEDY
jgi:transposase